MNEGILQNEDLPNTETEQALMTGERESKEREREREKKKKREEEMRGEENKNKKNRESCIQQTRVKQVVPNIQNRGSCN